MAKIKYTQWKNQNEIEKQKFNLLSQNEILTKRNNELTQSLKYLNSTSFKERVAREELNLKKEGEVVYSFGNEKENTELTPKQTDGVSNFEKWWNYFFYNH